MANLNQPQLHCLDIQTDNKLYDIKVSFLGSVGIDISMFWQSQQQSFIETINNYQPMDTVKLRFRNDANRNENCFYVVGYQISRGLTHDTEFQYIIKLEEVLIDDLNWTYLSQYLFVIVVPLIVVQFIKQ
ncbi:unnamed protein product (macronuclear) [Paramecium tetraurelia]|uniref:Uncharacterized protein n=1 Tax=Paramecium tetraurelia TaxID=5888 RepID=A0E2N9_PARTE|nr:uncharacterized protein GSPATT00022728001 [Paramecium tetraurelia]CAK89556.1 unnamed protein product [Paramecium tetraurelia]|eukprot:XP_001456953.1 hypothetical protein (macronuclear) [Paramecium tetraurelia strain d4-2]